MMGARAVLGILGCAAVVVASPALQAAGAAADIVTPTDAISGRNGGGTVWYQGYLADSVTAEPLTGTYDVVAAIYTLAAGGAPVWGPEAHNSTQVLEGWFHVELGSIVTPFLEFSFPPYYLELTVNGEVVSPRQKLASVPTAIRLDGTAKVTEFEMPTGASAGHVLTSDAAGNASWQPASGTVGGGGSAGYLPRFTAPTTLGDSGVYQDGGDLGVGTTAPEARLHVEHSTIASPAVKISSAAFGTQSDGMVVIERSGGIDEGSTLLAIEVADVSAPSNRFIECEEANSPKFYVKTNGDVYAAGRMQADRGVTGLRNDDVPAGFFESSYPSGSARCILASYTGTGAVDAVAIEASSVPDDYYGVGGRFTGGWKGVEGIVSATGAFAYSGVAGLVSGGSGANYGVRGTAVGAGTNYGIYGEAGGGVENWAGYFVGNVRVTGSVTQGLAALEIDHPLDPAGSTLHHAFVGSSEMLNVYTGNVVLDASGEAVVEMPDWFEALNEDFRYQLTCVGAFAPVYVAEKILGGSFRIAGGVPGMEVSWQVTGVRRDPAAAARGFGVEAAKAPRDVGRYLDPAAYGASDEMRIGRREGKE